MIPSCKTSTDIEPSLDSRLPDDTKSDANHVTMHLKNMIARTTCSPSTAAIRGVYSVTRAAMQKKKNSPELTVGSLHLEGGTGGDGGTGGGRERSAGAEGGAGALDGADRGDGGGGESGHLDDVTRVV